MKFWVVCLSLFSTVAMAQTLQQTPNDIDLAPTSFADQAMRNMRSSIGLSVGVSESYSSKVSFPGQESTASPRFTSVQPSVFLRNHGEKSNLSMIYSVNFGTYAGSRKGNTTAHSGSLDFSRRLSNRLSLNLNDTLSSAVNDYFSFNPNPFTNYASTFVSDLDVSRQRVTQNSAVAALSYRIGARTRLSGQGTYDFWHYGSGVISDTHGFQVGLGFEHQFNKWLSVNNGYSTYINKVTEKAHAAQIHRLQLGGLSFRPRPRLEINVGGGGETTTHDGKREFGATAQVGVSKQSRSTLLNIGYNRGFSGASGTTDVFATDSVAASYTQWMSQRVNLRVTSRYTVGSSKSGGSLNYVIGTAELSFALSDHSSLSADYSYLSQELVNLNVGPPRSNRYWARVGFQYFLTPLGLH